MFKLLHLPGAAVLIGIGFSVLTILYLIMGFQISARKWLGILGGIGLGVINAGIMLKILHLPGASTVLSISLAFIPIVVFSFISLRNYWRRFFHRILINNAIVITFMSLLFLWEGYNKFQLGYQHYTMNFNKIDEMLNLRNDALVLEEMVINDVNKLIENKIVVSEHINRFYSYRQEYDPLVNFSNIHWRVIFPYYTAACHILENGESPGQLEIGLQITRAANDAGKNIGYHHFVFYETRCPLKPSFSPLLEAELLLKLDRKEEAEKALVNLIEVAPSDIKEELQQRLTEISSN